MAFLSTFLFKRNSIRLVILKAKIMEEGVSELNGIHPPPIFHLV